MRNETKTDTWWRLLLILLCLLPLVVLFLLPGGGFLQGGLWFWVVLLICWMLIWSILGTPANAARRIRTSWREVRAELKELSASG